MLGYSKWKLAVVIAPAVLVVVSAPIIWDALAIRRIDSLVADLGSADYATRTRAEDALGALRSSRDIRRLVWHIGDYDARTKSEEFALVFALIGKDAVEPLISISARNDSRPWYVTPLLSGLVKDLMADYIDASNERRSHFRESAPGMFRYLGKPAEERLVSIIGSADVSNHMFGIQALTQMLDADALRPLIRALNNTDPNVRVMARYALCTASLTTGIEPITGLTSLEIDSLAGGLADKDSKIRRATASLLGICDSPAAADKLAALLVSPDEDTRILSAIGLSIKSDARALPILLEEVKARDMDHLGFNIGVLGRYDDSEAVSLLVTALSGPKDSTHPYPAWGPAAWGLAQILARKDADPAARESADNAIRDALSSDDARRRAALNMLVGIKDKRAIDLLKAQLHDSDPNKRASALFGLGNCGAADAGAAIDALQDREARVRSAAVVVLGMSRDPGAESALVKALQDGDAGVRSQAAQSLLHRKCLDAARKNGARIPDE